MVEKEPIKKIVRSQGYLENRSGKLVLLCKNAMKAASIGFWIIM
jgi:hypothetical protein